MVEGKGSRAVHNALFVTVLRMIWSEAVADDASPICYYTQNKQKPMRIWHGLLYPNSSSIVRIAAGHLPLRMAAE